MQDNIKKGIAGVALASAIAGGGAVAIDRSVVTDAEIRASIEEAVVEGKIPEVDLSKVSLDRLAQGYMDVAIANGVNVTPSKEQVDLYEKIRDTKANHGEKLSPKTNAVLRVQ